MVDNQLDADPKSDVLETDDIEEKINKVVHSAITTRNKPLDKELKDIKAAMESLKDAISSIKSPAQPIDEKPQKVPNSEILKMKAEWESMRAENEQNKRARMQLEMETRIHSKLESAKISAQFIEPIKALLIDRKKSVYYDEDGSLVFKGIDGPMDFDFGMNTWLKSKEAEPFRLGSGINGAGSKKVSTKEKQLPEKDDFEAVGKAIFGQIKQRPFKR